MFLCEGNNHQLGWMEVPSADTLVYNLRQTTKTSKGFVLFTRNERSKLKVSRV